MKIIQHRLHVCLAPRESGPGQHRPEGVGLLHAEPVQLLVAGDRRPEAAQLRHLGAGDEPGRAAPQRDLALPQQAAQQSGPGHHVAV